MPTKYIHCLMRSHRQDRAIDGVHQILARRALRGSVAGLGVYIAFARPVCAPVPTPTADTTSRYIYIYIYIDRELICEHPAAIVARCCDGYKGNRFLKASYLAVSI